MRNGKQQFQELLQKNHMLAGLNALNIKSSENAKALVGELALTANQLNRNAKVCEGNSI